MNCPKRTHVLTKHKILLGRGAPEESNRVGDPGKLLCHTAHSLGLFGDRISFRVVFGQSFWLRVLPRGAHIVQPRWMPARRILGGGQTCGVSFWPCLNSSDWWWLISSVFLTRTSCDKISQADGYCGIWPRWAVSVSASPNIWTCVKEFCDHAVSVCECMWVCMYLSVHVCRTCICVCLSELGHTLNFWR